MKTVTNLLNFHNFNINARHAQFSYLPYIYEVHFECHDILMLGKSPIKWRQLPVFAKSGQNLQNFIMSSRKFLPVRQTSGKIYKITMLLFIRAV